MRACTLLAVFAVSVAAAAQNNVVFVTSTTYASNLGSTAAYDSACNTRATAAGLNSVSGNDFIAWISDSTSSATARLGVTARGFVRVDGAPIADTQSSWLSSNTVLNPINRDEFGALVSAELVWTGTAADGTTTTTATCNNWTGTGSANVGATQGGPRAWTQHATISCATDRRLYCVQKTRTQPLTQSAPTGRLAFITAGTFSPGGGLAAADALCTQEASSAALEGTWRAFLATSTASAVSRLQAAEVEYQRTDGIRVADMSQLNTSSPTLDSGIWRTSTGTYVTSVQVWTGSSSPNAVGTAASTCNDWTSNVNTSTATTGLANVVSPQWWSNANPGCASAAVRLYCVQPSGGAAARKRTGQTVSE